MFLITLSTIILAVLYRYYFYKVDLENDSNVPSVSGLPIVWAFLRKLPHDEVEEVTSRSSGGHGAFMIQFGPYKQINFVDPEYVKDLFSASDDVAPKFEYHSGNLIYDFFGKGLPFSNGETWRTYRRLATSAFNNALSPDITGEVTTELFTFMQDRLNEPINIFAMFQRLTVEVLGKLAFGYKFGCLESDKTPHIISVYQSVISTVYSPSRVVFPWLNGLPLEANRKFFNDLDEFNRFIFKIVEQKKDKLKNTNEKENSNPVDLITRMLELSEHEGIETDVKQLRDEVVNYFVAGHDTTSFALSTSCYYLAKNPEIQERARMEAINILGDKLIVPTSEQLKEMKYITAIIKESLRIHPPSSAINLRKPTKPIKAGPYVVPKDTLCMVNLWQIHHNPKYWENPKKYDPDRFLNNEKRHTFSWIPFSAGHRNCIGQNFSLMEQKVALSMFLLKYKWTLPENSINKEKILLEPHFLLRPINLELVFTERN